MPRRKPASHSAGQRSHAADHNNDKGQNQEVHTHVIIRRIDRRVHHTGKPGDRSGNTEHQREAPVDINAKQPDRFTIRHAGTHDHAEGGELQECRTPFQ